MTRIGFLTAPRTVLL